MADKQYRIDFDLSNGVTHSVRFISPQGEKGDPGKNGVSPTVNVEPIDGGHRVIINDESGEKSFEVMNGEAATGGSEPYQQLVTDGEGNTVWADRLAYDAGTSVETLLDLTFEGTGEDNNNTMSLSSPVETEPIEGETYTVMWNGTAYKCAAKKTVISDDAYAISLGDEGITPFGVVIYNQLFTGGYGFIASYDNAVSVPVSILHETENIKKVDPKFLPEGIGYEDPNALTYILPETELVYGSSDDNEFYYFQPLGATLTAGESYVVTYNGENYPCVAVSMPAESGMGDAVVLGNIELMSGTGDTGEPFVLIAVPDALVAQAGLSLVCLAEAGVTSVTLSIAKGGGGIHKIDPKYLGETQEDNSYKQLVTNKDGNAVWEEQLAYENEGTYVEILPETYVKLVPDVDIYTEGFITTPFSAPLVVGENYSVDWNGTLYQCDAKQFNNNVIVGEETLYNDSSIPFRIQYITEPVEHEDGTIIYGYISAMDGSTDIKLSIFQGEKGFIRTVDPKFLPEGIGYEYESKDGTKEILPESTIEWGFDFYGITTPFTENLIQNETYILTYDGVEYQCIGELQTLGETETVCLIPKDADGNLMFILWGGIEPTEIDKTQTETFMVYGIISDPNGQVGGKTISIHRKTATTAIHKIDPKYLPEGIGYEVGGGTADEILPPTQLEQLGDGTGGPYGLMIPPARIPAVGETCIVKYNGVEYECVAESIESDELSAIGLGNTGAFNNGADLEGPPFAFAFVSMGEVFGLCAALDFASSVTIAVMGSAGTNIHRIDPKYLPAGIGYETTEMIEILPETELENDEDLGFVLTTPPATYPIVGETYHVIYNGVPYQSVAKSFAVEGESIVCLGNDDYALNGVPDEGPDPSLPMYCLIFLPHEVAKNSGQYAQLVAFDGASSATISISGASKVVHRIPKKFIDPEIFIVKVEPIPNENGYTMSCTYEDLETAYNAGNAIFCRYFEDDITEILLPLASQHYSSKLFTFSQFCDRWYYCVDISGYDGITISKHLELYDLRIIGHDGLELTSEIGKSYKLKVDQSGSLNWQRGGWFANGLKVGGTSYSDENAAAVLTTNDIDAIVQRVIEAIGSGSAPQYTNMLPISTDATGSVYNGKGWKANTRYSASSNAESGYDGIYLSGYIPARQGDVVRLKNVGLTTTGDTARVNVVIFGSDKTLAWAGYNVPALQEGWSVVLDSDGTTVKQFTVIEDCAYIRINASYLGDDSIITVNQEIS